jgi:hypothetical protein
VGVDRVLCCAWVAKGKYNCSKNFMGVLWKLFIRDTATTKPQAVRTEEM